MIFMNVSTPRIRTGLLLCSVIFGSCGLLMLNSFFPNMRISLPTFSACLAVPVAGIGGIMLQTRTGTVEYSAFFRKLRSIHLFKKTHKGCFKILAPHLDENLRFPILQKLDDQSLEMTIASVGTILTDRENDKSIKTPRTRTFGVFFAALHSMKPFKSAVRKYCRQNNIDPDTLVVKGGNDLFERTRSGNYPPIQNALAEISTIDLILNMPSAPKK